MSKNNEVRVNLFVPTLYHQLDIMLGQNIRDQKTGELTAIERGMRLGWQYVFGAKPGIGKSTFCIEIMAAAKKAGYPIIKAIIVDSDNAAHTYERLAKICKMSIEDVKELFEVWSENVVEKVATRMVMLSNEYNKNKEYKDYVVFNDPYTNERIKMRPFYIFLVDTVTSMVAERNSASDLKDRDAENMVANESSMTAFLKLSNLSNDVVNLFDGNGIYIWTAHLKKNNKEFGQHQATKELKTSDSNWKLHIPERIRQKASAIIVFNSVSDGNIESDNHPINKYSLEDIESRSVFSTTLILNKSRTGSEGRTQARLVFVNGSFDMETSLIASCLDLGVLKVGSGRYPSAEFPHVFKNVEDAERENEIMGRRQKSALTVRGYDYPTNIIEARLLLKYTGDNIEVINRKYQLMLALYQELEEKLWYELEINTISEEEIQSNNKRTAQLFEMLRQVSRKEVFTKDDLEAKKKDQVETIYTVDDSERQSVQED